MQYVRRIAWGGAAGVVAYNLPAMIDPERRNETLATALSYRRALDATVCVASIILDYKYSLRGVEPESDEYKQIRSAAHLRAAKRMLTVAQNAKGGIFVKAGQHIVSLKPAVPAEFTDTLSLLHDQLPPRPWAEVQGSIVEELGASIESEFLSIDPNPIGAASLAQVHKAMTLDGTTVALKVQHRHLRRESEADLAILNRLTSFASWCFEDFQFEWIMPEFRENLLRELDFENEGLNAEKCAAMFRGNRHVYVPKIFWRLTTPRMLVMEFVEGARGSDLPAMRAMGLDTRGVARVVSNLFSEQIFCHGFVHCDPHPGNLLVRPVPKNDSSFLQRVVDTVLRRTPEQVVLLDHGLYRALRPDFREHFSGIWCAMVTRDVPKLQFHCDVLGVGEFALIFPIIFTHRDISSSSVSRLGERPSTKQREELHAKFKLRELRMADFAAFLERLPRDMLFVLRTLNLVRALNLDLGGTTRDRFWTQAIFASSGKWHQDIGPSLPKDLLVAELRRGIKLEPHATGLPSAPSLWTRLARSFDQIYFHFWLSILDVGIGFREAWKGAQ